MNFGWIFVPPDQIPSDGRDLQVHGDRDDVFPTKQLANDPFGDVIVVTFKVSHFNRRFNGKGNLQLPAFGGCNDISARFQPDLFRRQDSR